MSKKETEISLCFRFVTDLEKILMNHSVQYNIGSRPLLVSGLSSGLGGSLDCSKNNYRCIIVNNNNNNKTVIMCLIVIAGTVTHACYHTSYIAVTCILPPACYIAFTVTHPSYIVVTEPFLPPQCYRRH